MSWQFWSDFLNSKEDYYPIQNETSIEAEEYEKNHPKETGLIEKIMDNPELIKKLKKEEE